MEDLGFSAEELQQINQMAGSGLGEQVQADYEPQLPQVPNLDSFSSEAKAQYFALRNEETLKLKTRHWNQHPPQASTAPLITKHEKIQRFIKKLKGLNEETSESLMQEIESLNLSKYLSEVACALSETRMNQKDLSVLVSAASKLHQKYPGFKKLLEENLKKQHKEGDVLKKRSVLRFITELIVFALWDDIKGFLRVINSYVNPKQEVPNEEVRVEQLGLVTTVIRNRSEDLLGFPSSSRQTQIQKGQSVEFTKSCVLEDHERQQLLQLLTQMHTQGAKSLQTLHQVASQQEAKNKKIKLERSVVDEQNLKDAKELRLKLSRGLSSLQVLSDVICKDMIDLAEVHSEESKEVVEVDLNQVFESTEDKDFYLNLPEIYQKKQPETTWEDFRKQLIQCVSKEMVDELCEAFLTVSNKHNRKALIDFLAVPSRHTLHLVPYYARLVACLGQTYKEISTRIINKLDSDIKGLKDYADSHSTEQRIRQVKFLAELLKAQVASSETLLNHLEACISDFRGANIEVAVHILSSCGRYLYLHPQTSERVSIMLERIQRLKNKKNLSPEIEHMIDEACFACKPPEKLLKKKPKHPLYSYILWVLNKLSSSTYQTTIQTLKSLPMPESQGFLVKAIIKYTYLCKVQNLTLIANLLAAVKNFNPLAGTICELVDSICEEILVDLNVNDFRKTQNRLLMVMLLGELFCYRIVEPELIYDLLYSLLYYSENQNTEDNFRAKLVWTLLDRVKNYFLRPQHSEFLSKFLVHFQHHIATRQHKTLELEFLAKDVLETFKPSLKATCFEAQQKPQEEPVHQSSSEGEKEFEEEIESMLQESFKEAEQRAPDRERNIPSFFKSGSPSNFNLLVKQAGKVKTKNLSLPDSHPFTQMALHRVSNQQEDRKVLSQKVSSLVDE
mgnify:FL=1